MLKAVSPRYQETLSSLASIWCGAIIGVSFLATPIKFTAPLIDMKEALDLGRVTFGLFGPLELLFAVGLLGLVLWRRSDTRTLALVLTCLALTLVENLSLRPLLDARVAVILAGQPAPASALHTLYVISQAAKLVTLLLLAFRRTSPSPGVQKLSRM